MVIDEEKLTDYNNFSKFIKELLNDENKEKTKDSKKEKQTSLRNIRVDELFELLEPRDRFNFFQEDYKTERKKLAYRLAFLLGYNSLPAFAEDIGKQRNYFHSHYSLETLLMYALFKNVDIDEVFGIIKNSELNINSKNINSNINSNNIYNNISERTNKIKVINRNIEISIPIFNNIDNNIIGYAINNYIYIIDTKHTNSMCDDMYLIKFSNLYFIKTIKIVINNDGILNYSLKGVDNSDEINLDEKVFKDKVEVVGKVVGKIEIFN